MNASKLVLAFAASATLLAAAPIFAATPSLPSTAQPAAQQTQVWTPASNAANVKITRAQVRHELVEAQRDGQLAALQQLYRGN